MAYFTNPDQTLLVSYNNSAYCKLLNISPMFIEVFKHIFGGLYSGGLYSGGLIFRGHFVLVGEYQDLKNHCFISLS